MDPRKVFSRCWNRSMDDDGRVITFLDTWKCRKICLTSGKSKGKVEKFV